MFFSERMVDVFPSLPSLSSSSFIFFLMSVAGQYPILPLHLRRSGQEIREVENDKKRGRDRSRDGARNVLERNRREREETRKT